jgi:uncharacterized membrane protein (DUF373 family)
MEKINDMCNIFAIIMIFLLCIGMFVMAAYSVAVMPSEFFAGVLIALIILITSSLHICILNE